MPKTLIVLPAFNEAETLPPLLERIDGTMGDQSGRWEVIVVNDGSEDATGEAIDRAAGALPVTRIDHEQNRGLGPAIKTGLRAAIERCDDDDDIIVCMDADNTHDPNYIPELAAKVAGGAGIVICSRYRPGSLQIGVPPFRRFLSFGARILFAATLRLPGVRDYTCGYRAYRASVVRKGIERYGDRLIEREGFACTDELLVRLAPLAGRIEEIPFVLHYERKRGRSKLPLFQTIGATFRLILHRPK